MEYTKSAGGKWANADEIQDGIKAKILTECVKQESRFKDAEGNAKTENVAKVRFAGAEEAVNMRLNWTTIYGLIDAFGNDSKNWMGHTLSVKTIDAMVGDTMRTIVYLIPEGFELAKNEEKKLVIRKQTKQEPPAIVAKDIPEEESEEGRDEFFPE